MKRIDRRSFLRSAGIAAGAGLAGLGWPRAGLGAEVFHGAGFVQRVDEVRLYMTHYALFQEPDPEIPAAIYIDADTGMPTSELTLVPPCE